MMITFPVLSSIGLLLLPFSLSLTSVHSNDSTSSGLEIFGNFSLYAVYFAFIPPGKEYYARRIQAHLSDYVSSGLCRPEIPFVISISVSSNSPDNVERIERVVNISRSTCPSAVVKTYFENWYEYFGVMEVWKIAQRIPRPLDDRSLILYFHSNGMTSDKDPRRDRSIMFKVMFKYVIFQWKTAINYFNHHNVNKAGIGTSDTGFQYGNFWWARASYVKLLMCPVLHNENRWYYENWLSYRRKSKHEQFKCGNGSTPKVMNMTVDSFCPCAEPYYSSGPRDSVTLCPPGTAIGAFYYQVERFIPCWNRETLPNGTVHHQPEEVIYTLPA